jgi:hypothetical protein
MNGGFPSAYHHPGQFAAAIREKPPDLLQRPYIIAGREAELRIVAVAAAQIAALGKKHRRRLSRKIDERTRLPGGDHPIFPSNRARRLNSRCLP